MLLKVNNRRKLFIIILVILIILIIPLLSIVIIDVYVEKSGEKYIKETNELKKADAIIILGAFVFEDGTPSDMLEDRLKVGLDLYNDQKAPKILVSGDHGKVTYDEVNNMRMYLENKGVPKEDIFMDHAGFCTYDSVYRAKQIFEIKNAIFVTQKYHLVRAIYMARKFKINAYGVSSDLRYYLGTNHYRLREYGSRLKAFFYSEALKPKPKFLGEKIPISGDGRDTHDIIE
ncbi:MAG: ElyC/SanA/YdcF family protein [Clostridiales bacterium]